MNFNAARIEHFFNPELQREKIKMLNAGVDFNLKDSSLYGSIEFYHKRMYELFGMSPVDVTAGLGRDNIVRNVGEMVANGLDIDLSTDKLLGKVRWSTNLLVNLNKDKMLKLFTKNDLLAVNTAGGGIIGLEDYPARALFAFRFAGLDPSNGDPRGYLNGKPDNNYEAILGDSTQVKDLAYVGGLLPWLSGSLGNTVSWRNLSLTVRINFSFGNYFRRESIDYAALFNEGIGHSDYANRWQKPGDELHTNIPSPKYPEVNGRDLLFTLSDVLATDGSYIRLQNINFSYTISRAARSKSLFDNMKLYLALNNIAMIWRANREGIDPDSRLMKATANICLGARISLQRN